MFRETVDIRGLLRWLDVQASGVYLINKLELAGKMTDSHDHGKEEKGFGPLMAMAFSVAYVLSPFRRRRYKSIVEDLPLTDGKHVLDVGCGAGNLVFLIAQRYPGAYVTGIDPSEDMVKSARKKMTKLHDMGKVSLSPGSCTNVPGSEKFDVIVTSSSYHHWEDQQAGLRNLAEYLTEDGLLAIYESFYGEKSGGTRSSSTHSLSREEADKMVLDGYEKSITMLGKVISVKFTRRKISR